MGMANLESFLSDHIEGFFNKKFSSVLEKVELIKQLEKEMVKNQLKQQGVIVLPNSYEININGDDYQKLASRRVWAELYEAVEKKVICLDGFMDGDLSITINKDDRVTSGTCAIKSSYLGRPPKQANSQVSSHTIVLKHSDFDRPLNLPAEHMLVSLTATTGPDKDSYLEFGEKQIYIGRRDKNDFILTDSNASRMHAYISYERHRHVLYDAESTNGTLVNGQHVTVARLCPGDEIQIGSTVLLYEVI